MPPRMKDIAAAVGVSVVTVSKVLNGNPKISEGTRNRVLACAKKLGYSTNLAAKALVTGQSKMIGLIVPELMHGFYAEVAASLLESLRSEGYGLIISSSRDNPELEREELRQLRARNVDAFVVASCERTSKALKALSSEKPVVLLDRRQPGLSHAAFVGSDDVGLGRIATEHLLNSGYKKLAYFGGGQLSPSMDRQKGFADALRAAKVPLRKDWVVTLPQNEEQTHILAAQAMRAIIGSGDVPDGVFCFQDAIAYGVVRALREAGLRVPRDVGVVGCGHLRLNDFMEVPLTSIDQDTRQLGVEAGQLAMKMIEVFPNVGSLKALKRRVPAQLRQGKSTRKSS